MKRRGLLFFLCAVLAALPACVRNPITGRHEIHMLSQPAELKLGEESANAIIKEYGLYVNPTVQAYVNEVGNRITAVCERPELHYRFVILDTPLVNAFSVPGTVFMTRGILELIDDEAELAAVMGHEVGHITGYHAVKMMQKAYGYNFLATFAAIAGTLYTPRFENARDAAAYYETLYRGIGLMTAGFLYGYGRQFELQADRSGLRYAILAGYDPDAMVSFFKRMEKLGDDDASGLAVFLRSHPPTDERIKQIHKILALAASADARRWRKQPDSPAKIQQIHAALGAPNAQFKDNFDRYQDVVRSIPKESPEHPGKIRDRVYENPSLKLRLEVPPGWKIETAYGDQLVSFFSPDGKAQGELSTRRVEADPLLSSGDKPGFAGAAVSTEAVKVGDWARSLEGGMKMEKRTGREVAYPAGPAYAGTYIGMDRMGRPAFYKILFVLKGEGRNGQRGFMLSCAAPEQTYLDYLLDFEKIMESLHWTDGKAAPPQAPR